MEAIILAGGFGTRLRSVVFDRPKVLAEVAGKPFLYWLLESLSAKGVTKFIFSLGYLHELIERFLKEYFNEGSFEVVIENEPLGTGGAIMLCLQRASSAHVLVANGDTFFDIDLTKLLEFHLIKNADCTIAVKPMIEFDRYGSVTLDTFSRIQSFNEKQYCERGLINTGIILLNAAEGRRMLGQLPKAFSFEKDFLVRELETLKVYGFPSNGYFIDIGIPEDFLKAQKDFLSISERR